MNNSKIKKEKPFASVSLDLDNQWSYMKIHGDKGWDKYPTYLDPLVPYTLDMLEKLKLHITFFIVGRDADDKRNFDVLKEITKKGHEVANHSYNHESWFHLYSKDKIKEELTLTENSIEHVTGQKPIGFRGPGFSWSKPLLEELKNRNYLYDASTLPTFIGPLARLYYFSTTNLSKEEKEERSGLFGAFSNGFKKIKPNFIGLENQKQILEIPVSTIPFIKVPFHFSYLHYLAKISEDLMFSYLKFAIFMCKITKTNPSFLLHPLDLIGGDKIPELAYFPGMDLASTKKQELFEKVMRIFDNNFNLINMSEHAKLITEN